MNVHWSQLWVENQLEWLQIRVVTLRQARSRQFETWELVWPGGRRVHGSRALWLVELLQRLQVPIAHSAHFHR